MSNTSMQFSDHDVASTVTLRPIRDLLVERFNLDDDAITTYGKYKAKIAPNRIHRGDSHGDAGKLVLVTGVSPTSAGEGKTTTTIGLTDSLNRCGVNATACLREPSLGPCFGAKGGAHGGGYSQVAPLIDINLHFNGDIHAVTAANNLLVAVVENHVYWGNALDIDVESMTFRRTLDLNDRALRRLPLKLRSNLELEGGFNITAASEVMAVLCLAEDLADLRRRLGEIVVGKTRSGKFISVRDLQIEGALSVLLKDAIDPNVVQSLEHNPVFIHGGPFANIAHGCSSVIASRTALELADVVVTEAGFGADLGAEKFVNIKYRQSGLRPHAVVVVCTLRSLKMHGGVETEKLYEKNVDALRSGFANLQRHIENLQQLGLSPIVALNRFTSDNDDEIEVIRNEVHALGVACSVCAHWKQGGEGAIHLAETVLDSIERDDCQGVKPLYELSSSIKEKIEKIAVKLYRAKDVSYSDDATTKINELETQGFGNLAVCIAKTQYSFSGTADKLGAPINHTLRVRDVQLSAGAGFVVVICGNILTMPGLPKEPAALHFGFDENGEVVGF